jgi:hypothetical protein
LLVFPEIRKGDSPVNNHNWMPLLSGVALGAGAMFLLDPTRGARRRALIRDKAVRAGHKSADALDALGRDVANRARGVVAERMATSRQQYVSAPKLVERVRAELGRVVSHPRAIDVQANDDGIVCLCGPILAEEADAALKSIGQVRGVSGVEDQLDRRDSPEGVPALQGGRTRPGRRSALMQRSWSPTTTALATIAGTALAAGLGYAALGQTNTDWDSVV